jgi:antitoxin component of MazEF toxin-antitoxin module
VPRDRQPPLYNGIVQLGKEGNSVKLTVRRQFLDALGWNVGTVVRCSIVNGALVVRGIDEVIKAGEAAMKEMDEESVELAVR